MYNIPTSITVSDKEYRIRNNGDFRVILDCFQALSDIELTAQERLLAALIIFYEDFDTIENISSDDTEQLVLSMFKFFNCNSESSNTGPNKKLIDWEQDEQLICSAINKVCNKEIRLEPYVHWWTFLGYFAAIGDAPISTIMQIRDKIISGKKLERHEREYRMNNPQYFIWNHKSIEEQEAEKLVKEIWDSGG